LPDDDDISIDAPLTTAEIGAQESTPDEAPSIAADEHHATAAEIHGELQYWRDKAKNLDNRVFQMRTLLQSGKGFSEALSIPALLRAFMAVCRERYGVTNSTVMLLDDLDPDNVFYRVRACFGLPETYVGQDGHEEELLLFRLPHDPGMLWQVIHQGEVFSVRDMAGNPRFKTAFDHWNLEVLQSDVWIPLIRGSEVLGVLTLGACEDGSQVAEGEYDFLQEIAAVATTNIDSTLKYEKNARILSNLRTLYNVNQQLANVNDFKLLSIETLKTAVHALKAQKANLMLYDSEAEQLEIKVVWGNIPKQTRDAINDGRMETKAFALGEGVAGLAAKLRKPQRLNDRTQIKQVGRNLVFCILSVPMIYGGEVVGVMTLTNKVKQGEEADQLVLDTLGRFGEDDEQLLLGLADNAAVNLHKARLYSESITDRLTGLYNARHFEARLDGCIQHTVATEDPLSLAVTDIDHFKVFNDTYGHQAGDFVLTKTAQMLRDMVRDNSLDAAFRYGGEEFCMLLPATPISAAAAVLDEYRQRVEDAEFQYEGQTLKVTVSVGLSVCPTDGSTRTLLFEAADQAMYASKEGGRNRVSLIRGGKPRPFQAAKED
jgi:diguanylate cyclase (GGDEF)-like protein